MHCIAAFLYYCQKTLNFYPLTQISLSYIHVLQSAQSETVDINFQPLIPPSPAENKLLMRKSTYVMTMLFLIVGLIWTIVAIIFAVLNAFSNPIQWIVSYYGLLVWNGIATFCYFVVVRKKKKNA